MCIECAAGKQAGCNTDACAAGQPSCAKNGNSLAGKIKDDQQIGDLIKEG